MHVAIRNPAMSMVDFRPMRSAKGAKNMAPTVMPTSPELKTIPRLAGEMLQALAIAGAA